MNETEALAAIRALTAPVDVPNPYEYDPWDDDEIDPTNTGDVVSAAVSRGWDRGREARSAEVRVILDQVVVPAAATASRCGYVDCPGVAEPIVQAEHGPEHPTCKALQELALIHTR